jgi:hypothetical protein
MEAVIETLVISRVFTSAPGARNVEEGSYSGEEFLNKILKPHFEKALEKDFTILVDLDNTEGYATSFLEEAFGGLARIYGPEKVLNHLDFKSEDEPLLIDEIKMYIQEANL